MKVLIEKSESPVALECYGLSQDKIGSQIGSKGWWRSVFSTGAPFIKEENELVSSILFVWQDPQGKEATSSTAAVLLDVNSITDHHSWEPVCLQRVTGTDVWLGQLIIDSKWRGSYSFIPIEKHQLPDFVRQAGDGSKEAQRAWWISIANKQLADPLNPLPVIHSGWGISSPLHLPKAVTEIGWQEWDEGNLSTIPTSQVYTIHWSSMVLHNQRDAWLFSTAIGEAPLVILLDGQKWGRSSGMLSVLQYLTDTRKIAPAHYLLVSSLDGKTRWQELACCRPFWESVIDSLLPIVESKLAALDCTISEYLVAGQSLGGLSALYAGVTFPNYFSKVISLSGSFWWPDDNLMRTSRLPLDSNSVSIKDAPVGSLAEQIFNNKVEVAHLDVFLSVGAGEQDMCQYNDITYLALQGKAASVHYEIFCGGHDWLSWRSSLIAGLLHLLPADA